MSVASFQHALCDLIASPGLCLALLTDPDATLASYDLSPRERTRLTEVVWQRGMSTNCSLYRMNRITPIYTLLNHTYLALGDQFGALIEQFWGAKAYQDGQFQSEIERFGAFLRQQIAEGKVASPFAGELLAFELAKNVLEFSPRKNVLRWLAARAPADADAPPRLHPLARIVHFRHDPATLLGSAAAGALPPPDLPNKNALVVISVLDGDLRISELTAEGVRAFDDRAPVEIERLPSNCVRALADAGLLAPAMAPSGSLASAVNLNWHELSIN